MRRFPSKIARMVRTLDDIAARMKDRRSKEYRDLVAFLRLCPDSIYNRGYPPGYDGPSVKEITEVLVRH